MQSILVLGSEGQLGRSLCASLIAKSYRVYGIDVKARAQDEHDNYSYFEANACNYLRLKEVANSISEDENELIGLVNCSFHPELMNHDEFSLIGSRIDKLDAAFRQYSGDSFSAELIGNLVPMQNLIRAFLPKKFDQKFSVVNVSSVLGLRQPNPTHLDFSDRFRFKPPGYSVSKAAMIAFTEYCANLYAGTSFRFNAIAPGFLDAGQDLSFKNRFDERLSIRRFARFEEIVKPIEFLLSEDSSYMTGSTLTVDGGYLAT
jgi:NAD(P)-dependent dehydrogenase (short-subunit alcohol dehydrogenase family)